MTETFNKQAFLIVTQKPSKHVFKLYNKIKTAAAGIGDVFLLFHNNRNIQVSMPAGVKVATFTDSVLKDLQYKPIRTRLVPGSNHFPVLQFFLTNKQYQYYWCIEDDVEFNGKWADLIDAVSTVDYDFITSHIRRYSDIPDWFWWDSYRVPGEDFDSDNLISSFNPIYRISNRALAYVDANLKNGFRGHHEVLLPTMLKRGGYSIADFSTEANNITPNLSFCTLKTMRWLPVFLFIGNNKNKLYHPVKANVSFSQVMEYIRRTFKGKKRYFT
ncbi:MAG: hypothetical protein JNK79_12650 [Chitinophagaceae bacterium]|nr:hypothetical protein [Chitinophagaceae bacterium]